MTTNQVTYGNTVGGHGSSYMSFSVVGWTIYICVFWLLSFSSANPSITFACLALVPVFASLLWRTGEPPILFFCVMFQWLQVAGKVFDSNFRGLTVEEYYSGWAIGDAIWLSLIGLLVLAVGMRIALFNFKKDVASNISGEVASISLEKVFYLYLFLYLLVFFGGGFIWLIPRISQILLMGLNFKWVLFFFLALTVLGRREKYVFLWVAVLLEIFAGFTGFFASYKQVFFLLIIALMTFMHKLTIKFVIGILAVAVVAAYLTIIWSASKQEYRDYINLGSGQQVVLVSLGDRTGKLIELYTTANRDTFERGVDSLAKRVAYVDYFARVLEMVPSYIPHSGGEIWGKAIKHVLTPRVLFPDKAALHSDTEETEKYTGYRLLEQGGRATTIPLGYFTESYIDFGPYFMFVPIFLVGLVGGLIYRYFLSNTRELIFGYCIAVAVLIAAATFEVGATKLVGGILTGFIVLALLQKWVIPGLHRYLEDTPRA